MFENMMNFFKKLGKNSKQVNNNSKDAAKERLHLVLMQDRANVSADFLELMKQEIIDVIKKYIDVDEREIDVRLTNKENGDGTTGAPALYANIPILNIKSESRKIETNKEEIKTEVKSDNKEDKQEEKKIKIEKEEQSSKSKEEKNKKEVDSENKNETSLNEKKANNKKEENKTTKEKIKSENS